VEAYLVALLKDKYFNNWSFNMPDMNMNGAPMPADDHEAAMARADLYKLANYSFKLFKMIKDGDELEGWVQAKVTKAADYIASVYHYMEYELKVNEYGDKLENSDVYGESVRREFKLKLTEARVKLEKLKKKNIKEVDEAIKTDKPWTSKDGKAQSGTKVKGGKYTGKEAEKETKAKKVKEATVNELSGNLLKSYKKGAADDFQQRYPKVKSTFAKHGKSVTGDDADNARRAGSRITGLVKATKRARIEAVNATPQDVPEPAGKTVARPVAKPVSKPVVPTTKKPGTKMATPQAINDPITELSKGTLRAYSKEAGRNVRADQRDSKGAYDMSGEAGAHGDTKKAAAWDDEGMWLAKRAEKRAGNIAKATTKIAQKR
jgi:hypothetical protein